MSHWLTFHRPRPNGIQLCRTGWLLTKPINSPVYAWNLIFQELKPGELQPGPNYYRRRRWSCASGAGVSRLHHLHTSQKVTLITLVVFLSTWLNNLIWTSRLKPRSLASLPYSWTLKDLWKTGSVDFNGKGIFERQLREGRNRIKFI